MSNIADIRKEYKLRSLDEADVSQNPISQFATWWDDAVHSKIDEVNAMTLATVKSDGTPNGRIVLLKGFDENGFTFYTNYNSDKGKELLHNKKVCLIFFWKELERQVKIIGSVEKNSDAENDEYFNSRPEGSKIGAWSSPQSTPIHDRSVIEDNVLKFQAQFKDKAIPRPPHWGGYKVIPELVEFWQGRPSRLHDRILYTLQNEESWKIERLAP
ncbi:pyridoxamine 5'-phosphate oxidase [Ferruginibacter lapsinanis]|uniref:pyridoxamine 5'-phosphate oxidase n=1 Tax=Ferruginibacter lapsinanis TaxID=563172 RepID=UPI001E65AB99|nr:pyridoxamine 5'-phosphate oxidase [Ferruginibacter lapsinanis]UEG50592.1 pyridoxamine 5'-phosphate oxidase [Ferruginibacter lapsinanis]